MMTDRDYEKMMVEAANGKTNEARNEIAVLDARIEHYAQQVDILTERRRELINHFNLNKGDTNA